MGLTEQSGLIINLLKKAGAEIRKIELSGNYNTELKPDNSPVTLADYKSDSIIREGLKKLYPGSIVISEECNVDRDILTNQFWLLDPIDGTKEFIAGNGEYCISLALIEDGRPVEAYIYAPTSDELWMAVLDMGAFKLVGTRLEKLPLRATETQNSLLLLRSRSHHAEAEEQWYREASKKYKIEIRQQGSAIKFCRIAEGSADLYIKKGSIFGWDIAAGDLILRECGGRMPSYPDGAEIIYSTEALKMPHFLACSKRIKYPLEWLV